MGEETTPPNTEGWRDTHRSTLCVRSIRSHTHARCVWRWVFKLRRQQRGVQDNDGIGWGSGGAARSRADPFVRARRRAYVLQNVDGVAARRILDGSTLRGSENLSR